MKINNIDLNRIRVFQRVVERGNYQKASEELGLTRSAISQNITTLESQIGTPLFQRKGKKLFPTKDGQKLAEEFAQLSLNLEKTIRKIRNEDQQVSGLVRIGSYFEFAKTQLPPLIANFCQRHPDTEFKFSFNSPSQLTTMLENNQIDMALSIFPYQGSSEVQSIKIFEQELVLIAPKKWKQDALKIETLNQLPLIDYFTSHQLFPRWFKTHFKKHPRMHSPKVYAASAEMLLELVRQEVGIGILPHYLIGEKEQKSISIIRPTSEQLIDHIWLQQFPKQFANSAHQEFYQWLQQKELSV